MTRLQRGLLLGTVLLSLAVVTPLAVLVRDGWSPLRDADARAVHALRLPHGLSRDVALGLTQLGAPLLLELAAVVIAVLLLSRGRPRSAGYLLLTVLGAELLSTTSKHLVARVRPCEGLSGCPRSTSFPSGHALGSAAFWSACAVLLLPLVGRRAWGLLLVPVVVALTRVLLGVHYPSDVTVGLVMGGCWATAWTAVFAAWKDERVGRDASLEEGL